MMDVDTVVYNNKTYIEVDQVDVKDTIYVFLSNILDNNDMCIKKLVVKDGEVYYQGVKDKKELDLALMYFVKKNKGVLEI